jgi:hypothetical protein
MGLLVVSGTEKLVSLSLVWPKCLITSPFVISDSRLGTILLWLGSERASLHAGIRSLEGLGGLSHWILWARLICENIKHFRMLLQDESSFRQYFPWIKFRSRGCLMCNGKIKRRQPGGSGRVLDSIRAGQIESVWSKQKKGYGSGFRIYTVSFFGFRIISGQFFWVSDYFRSSLIRYRVLMISSRLIFWVR